MRNDRWFRAPCVALMLSACGLSACGLPPLPDPPNAGTAPAVERSAVAEWERAARRYGGTSEGCFGQHLREAMLLNEARAPVYAEWSAGRSEPISERLIRSERSALIVAARIDARARRFREAGIPIVCAEFVSMELTPPLPDAPLPPPDEPFRDAVDAVALRERLSAAYGLGGFPGVAAEADAQMERLAATPRYHCMIRHLLESMWRIALLAPVHEAAAAERGMGSTRALSEMLLRLHLAVLAEGAELDRASAPLQAAGIPIVCVDVPPIR